MTCNIEDLTDNSLAMRTLFAGVAANSPAEYEGHRTKGIALRVRGASQVRGLTLC